MKEHQDACRKGISEMSTVAEHVLKEHHPIRWEETSIVDPRSFHVLKEALHIQMIPSEERFNSDGGLELNIAQAILSKWHTILEF